MYRYNPLTANERVAIEEAARNTLASWQSKYSLDKLDWDKDYISDFHAQFSYLQLSESIPFMEKHGVDFVLCGVRDYGYEWRDDIRYAKVAICRKADYDNAVKVEHQKDALRANLSKNKGISTRKKIDSVFGRGKLPE